MQESQGQSHVRRESNSTDSSTISEFVKRRFKGDVPVFGGNPAVGLSEFGSALYGSVQQAQLMQAISGLTAALQGQTLSVNRAHNVTAQSRAPIVMLDNTSKLGEDFSAAAEIPVDRLQILLDASNVEPRDVSAYLTLLESAQRSVKRKQEAIKIAKTRKLARVGGVGRALDESIAEAVDKARLCGFQSLLLEKGIDMPQALLARALTHESAVGGYETNQRLAVVGDAVLKVLSSVAVFKREAAAEVMSRMVVDYQNNVALCEAGLAVELQEYLFVGPEVDAGSKKVVATAVEALYGAAYVYGGVNEAERLDVVFGIVDGVKRLADYDLVLEYSKY